MTPPAVPVSRSSRVKLTFAPFYLSLRPVEPEDGVSQEVYVYVNLLDACSRHEIEDVLQHRLARDRGHRFREHARKWEESGPLAGRQNHRFHTPTSLVVYDCRLDQLLPAYPVTFSSISSPKTLLPGR